MGATMQLVKMLTGKIVDMHTFIGIALQVVLSLGVGLIVYFLLAKLFKLKEMEAVTALFQRYTRRNAVDEQK
jgi:hypothetical protein